MVVNCRKVNNSYTFGAKSPNEKVTVGRIIMQQQEVDVLTGYLIWYKILALITINLEILGSENCEQIFIITVTTNDICNFWVRAVYIGSLRPYLQVRVCLFCLML
jgi:hypothetical protein